METSKATSDFKHHRFRVLDGLRGVAAICVMVYHYYQHGHQDSFKNAHAAVDFFFILSGFVIAHAYGDKLRNGMSALDYITRRIIRIYPMMLAGIVIGSISLYMIGQIGDTTYSNRDNISAVILNGLFVPFFNDKSITIDAHTMSGLVFPGNNPLWSILAEMLASVSFLLISGLNKRNVLRLCFVSLACLLISAVLHAFRTYQYIIDLGDGWGSLNILQGFARALFGFTAGVCIFSATESEQRSARLWAILGNPFLLSAILAAFLFCPYYFYGLPNVAFITLLAPAIVYLGSSVTQRTSVTVKIMEFLGYISYPLYCLHYPVFFIVRWAEFKYQAATHLGLSVQGGAIMMSLIASAVLAYIYDGPVRKKLSTIQRDLLPHTHGA